jgi:hypothetical protein
MHLKNKKSKLHSKQQQQQQKERTLLRKQSVAPTVEPNAPAVSCNIEN